MKKILEFFKFTRKNILINIIGMLMAVIGISIIYYHTILNEYLLFLISLPLVYFGIILLNRSIFHLTDTDKAMFAVCYFVSYMNYKKTGINNTPFTFEEINKELKAIREKVDEALSQEIEQPTEMN